MVGLQFVWLLTNIIIRPGTSFAQKFAKIGMETFLLFSFVLIAILDAEEAEEEGMREIR